MKQLLTLLSLLLHLLVFSQTRKEIFDYSFKPVKNGGYYYVVTEKKDSLFKREAWYLSQKTLYMEGWYKDEKCTTEHGAFKWYHPNGHLRETGQYVNGKKEGVWLHFDDEGRLTDSLNYALGWKKGIGMSWHKSGYMSDSTNFDGSGNGTQVRWYDDGSLSAAGYWMQDTLKRGRWKYYHRNGTVMAVEEYDAEGKLALCNCYDEKGVQLDTALCREKEAIVDKQQWRRFMERSLQPLIEQKAAQGISGNFMVVVRFIIDENGRVGDAKALTNYGYGIEEGVVNIFKHAPTWTPGSVHGRTVKSYHAQPVTFIISSR